MSESSIFKFVLLLMISSLMMIPPSLPAETQADGSGPIIDETKLPMDDLGVSANSNIGSPGLFIENKGQLEDDDVLYYYNGGGMQVAFKSSSIAYAISNNEKTFVYEVSFRGSNSMEPKGEERTQTEINFLLGNDQDQWITGIREFETLTFDELYEGIDLVFYEKDGKLKYDLKLEPMRDPGLIQIHYMGVKPIIEYDKIRIDTPMGVIWEDEPISFTTDGASLLSSWKDSGNGIFTFHFDELDNSRGMIIDPGVTFSSYIGGSGKDIGYDTMVDEDGFMYVTGETGSSNFPTTTGSYQTSLSGGQDVFISKINTTSGNMVFCTYIGGNSNDIAYALDMDSNNNIVITGETMSNNFPTKNAYDGQISWNNADAFLLELKSNGQSLSFSTFLGGWGKDAAYDVTVDGSDNMYITGEVGWFNNGWPSQYHFPTTSGAYDRTQNGNIDVFVTKFTSSGGSLSYSTMIGGNGNDMGYGIEVDGSGNAFITGYTTSSGYPSAGNYYDNTYNGGNDVIVSEISSTGNSLLYSTFLGGGGDDEGNAIDIDSSGRPVITGETSSSGTNKYPTTTNAYDSSHGGNNDVFITHLTTSSSALINSTFFGVGGSDSGQDIKIGPDGVYHVAGHTTSTSFPTTSDGFDQSFNGGYDSFILKMDMGGEGLKYSTLLGGSGNDRAYGIDVDDYGHIYVTGETISSDFPISLKTIDDTINGNEDAFACKFYPADFSPSNLLAEEGYFSINLSWNPPTRYVVDGRSINGYRLYRGLSLSSMELIASLGNVTYYNDSIHYFIARDYHYFVTATFDKLGESKEATPIIARPMVTPKTTDPVTTSGDLHVNVSWTPLDQVYLDMFDIDYIIYRGLGSNTLTQYARVGENGYLNDSGLPPIPRSYHYMISYEIAGVGESNYSAIIEGTPKTPPSEAVFNDIEYQDKGFSIGWFEPEKDGGYQISGYRLRRGPSDAVMEDVTIIDGALRDYNDTGLVPGRKYYYSISAINALGYSIETTAGPYIARTTPSEPNDLITTGSNGRIDISWSPPREMWDEPLTGYNVYKKSGTGSMEMIGITGPGMTSFIQPSTNGVISEFAVSAVNSLGEGPISEIIQGMAVGVPERVNVIGVDVGDGSASIRWELVQNNGGSPITRYSVYRSTDFELPHILVNLSSKMDTFKESGLENGKTYYYWVSAWNAHGEGDLSPPFIAIPGTLPPSVIDLTAQPDLERIILRWTVPDDLGGKPGVEANIWRGRTPGSVRPYQTVPIGQTRFVDDPVEGETEFYYRVSLTNTIGEGEVSGIISASAYGIPSAPGFTNISVTSKKVTLNWSEPEKDGGSEITGYRLQYRREGEQAWEYVEVNERTYTFTNLLPGKGYSFMVTAENLITTGDDSEIREILVGEVPNPPLEIRVYSGPGNIKVEWDIAPGIQPRATGFNVYMGTDENDLVKIRNTPASSDTIRVGGLLNGLGYYFAVSCINDIGEGPLSVIKQTAPMDVPSVVNDIWIENTEDGSILIKWDPPLYDGGSEIQGYDIYKDTKEFNMDSIASIDNFNEYLDQDVENGQTYYYMVRARNIKGNGEEGTRISATPLGVPDSPGTFDASTSTDNVRLAWSPPANTGGSPLKGYLIFRSQGSSDKELIADLPPEVNTYIDEDVKTGRYTYAIMARSEVGSSSPLQTEVDIQSRTGTAVLYGFMGLIIPIVVFLLIILVPGYLRRRKEEKEKQRLKDEEEERKIRQMRAESLLNQPKKAPALGTHLSPNGLSSAQPRQDLPPAEETKEERKDEGYIRPSARKKDSKKDKKRILRADGKSLEHREEEEDRRHNLKSKEYEGSHKWEHERKKVLEKEASSVFTGQQHEDAAPDEMMKAPPPMTSIPEPGPSIKDEDIPMQDSPEIKKNEPAADTEEHELEEIDDWEEHEEIPLSDPPGDQEELDFNCEAIDDEGECVEDFEEIEELEEIEEMEE